MIKLRSRVFYNLFKRNEIHISCSSDIPEKCVGAIRLLTTTHCLREGDNVDKLIEYGIREEKSSKAMRAYLERSRAYNQFMEKEQEEYKTGKRHLANMMGRDPENFTQKDVDAAIEYLLPSGLFVKKARPHLKPPEEVHPSKKEAEFDETGRPFHYQFYTGRPTFYNFLHKLVAVMKELNDFEDSMIRKHLKPDPNLAVDLEGYSWCTKVQFEEKFIEEITKSEYNELINTLDRLVAHPYSYRVKDLITDCRQATVIQSETNIAPKPELEADGREVVIFNDSRRKTARADVTVRSPGTGLLTINGHDLTYFDDLHVREQKRNGRTKTK